MELYFIALLIITKVFITFSTQYELEFSDMEIYSVCENYPNNSIYSLADMSNLKIEQTEEGSLNVQGYSILKKSVDAPTPASIDLYKKVRGTWQPTIYSQKRIDTCTACFSKLELWHSYLKSTPEEQLTCPFREGITFSRRYELAFLNSEIYSPCESYPNNSIYSLFDMSNLKIEQTQEGSLGVKGYAIVKKSVDAAAPLSIEIFKRVRGTWQPTIYTQKRADTCIACFGKGELWHSYLKNTPKEQLMCPFREGQRIDFDINEPTYIDIAHPNGEGEYKVHVESGHSNDNFYVCVDIFATIYKV